MFARDSSSPQPSFANRLPFFYGWIVVVVAFVSMGIGVSNRIAFSLLYSPILEEFGWERGVTAGAFSIGFIAALFYSPFIGNLMDRWGARVVIASGVILVSSGLILATNIHTPWQLYLTFGVLVVGGSISMTYIGHGMFLPNWFVRKRGLAVGIAFSGVGLGSIILLPWLQNLIDESGWRQACWAMAIVLLVVLLPLNLLLQRQRPQELGLLPDGDSPDDEQIQESSRTSNVVDARWVAIDWTLAKAMRTMRFWWIFMAFFSILFAWYAVQVHQTRHLIDLGFSASQAAFALGLAPFLGIFGQIGVGHMSDRLGREWGWTLSGTGFALSCAILLIMKDNNPLLMYLMVATQGLLGYGSAPIYAAVPAEVFQSRQYGKIFGTLSMSASLGIAAGPWTMGFIYDMRGDYWIGFQMALFFSLFSILCIWIAAPRKIRVVAGQVKRLKLNRR